MSQVGVSCTSIQTFIAPSMDSEISQVTEQFNTINDAVTRHFLKSDDNKRPAELVEEGTLAAIPKPPLGLGLKYRLTWIADLTGTNKNMEVAYIVLPEVPDNFCKAWNNAKHPELGRVIIPNCQESSAPYTCSVSKLLGAEIQEYSPPDQCGQTCCVAGNVILFKNGYVHKKD
jgi:hypothetical protein